MPPYMKFIMVLSEPDELLYISEDVRTILMPTVMLSLKDADIMKEEVVKEISEKLGLTEEVKTFEELLD